MSELSHAFLLIHDSAMGSHLSRHAGLWWLGFVEGIPVAPKAYLFRVPGLCI